MSSDPLCTVEGTSIGAIFQAMMSVPEFVRNFIPSPVGGSAVGITTDIVRALGCTFTQCNSGDPPIQIYTSFYNYIFSSALSQTVQTCGDSISSNQYIGVNCLGDALTSKGCKACNDSVTEALRQAVDLYSDAQQSSLINEDLFNIYKNDSCKYACKSCILDNITQSTNINITLDCVNKAEFKEQLKTAIQAQMTSYINSKQDALGIIGNLLANPNDCLISELSNKMFSFVESDNFNKALENAITSQTFNIAPSSSVFIQRVIQSTNSNLIMGSNMTSDFFSSFYSETEMKAAQEAILKNTTIVDYIKQLSVNVTTSSDVFNSTMGKLMTIVVVVMLIAICGIGGYLLFKRQEEQR